MSKPSRKLSLKKETLRQLDPAQLGQVGGGVYLDWVILSVPSKSGTTTRTDGTTLFMDFNQYYFYY
ncbi:MAG TPA: class I lanthipeptide [Kofleriaceae bacterium]|nr:class I lanthipeptide [Kofleriaceae bacterium]